MDYMYHEIREQIDVFKECKDYNQRSLREIKEQFQTRKIKSIVLAARGSSDNAGNYFRYLAEVYLHIPVSLSAPSVLTVYDASIDYQDSLVIGVSQSGQAEDVLSVMKCAKEQGAIVIGLTNDLSSKIANLASYHLYMNVGKEKSVAATKTFMAEMYLLALLVSHLSNDAFSEELNRVPNYLKEVLKQEKQIEEVAKEYINVEECYVLARGYLYAIAQESALKIQETCYINAKAYSISDFHHGPFAVLDEDSHVILFANQGKTYQDATEIYDKIKSTGAKVLVVSSDLTPFAEATTQIQMPFVEEVISPFPYILAMQLFAYQLSKLRGNNPDVPRGLKKVTITK